MFDLAVFEKVFYFQNQPKLYELYLLVLLILILDDNDKIPKHAMGYVQMTKKKKRIDLLSIINCK